MAGRKIELHHDRDNCFALLHRTRRACAQADRERFARLGTAESGRGAGTVYRDRASGKRVSADELAAAAARERKPKSETPAWGGGIAQVRPTGPVLGCCTRSGQQCCRHCTGACKRQRSNRRSSARMP